MKKQYAKNPAEIMIVNPGPKKSVQKDPRRVAAGKAAWRKRQQTQKTKTMSKRVNPGTVAKTGKTMLVKYGLAAVGTIGAVRMTDYLIQKFGSNLPSVVKNYSSIVFPAAAGIVIATKAKKTNEVVQGIAGGMVYSAVSQTFNRVLPNSVTRGLSDALTYKRSSMIAEAPGSMKVTPGGQVVDQSGHVIGNARIAAPKTAVPVLADSYSTSGWEDGQESYHA